MLLPDHWSCEGSEFAIRYKHEIGMRWRRSWFTRMLKQEGENVHLTVDMMTSGTKISTNELLLTEEVRHLCFVLCSIVAGRPEWISRVAAIGHCILKSLINFSTSGTCQTEDYYHKRIHKFGLKRGLRV
jgi:hypothetical protein